MIDLGSYSGRVPLTVFDLGPAASSLLLMCWRTARAGRSLSVVIDDDIRKAAGLGNREQVRRAIHRITAAGHAIADSVSGRQASLLLASWPDFHRSMQMPKPYYSGAVFVAQILALTGPAMKLLLLLRTRAKRDGSLTMRVDLKTARRAGVACSWTFADAIGRLAVEGHLTVAVAGKGRARVVHLAEWPGFQMKLMRRPPAPLTARRANDNAGRSVDLARFSGGTRD